MTSNSKHDRAGGGNSDPVVHVNGTDLQIVRYRDEPVVTFAMIDKVHGRVDGTARRAFNENRERFVEGEDLIVVNQADEIRSLGLSRPQGGTPAAVNLITRRGYLKLVKSLNDDVAWNVFEVMIDRYFSAERPTLQAEECLQAMVVEAVRVVLRREWGSIVQSMVQAEMASQRHKLVVDHMTVGEVLDLEKVPSKGRRGLINASASSLRRFCEDQGIVPRRTRNGRSSAYVYSPEIAVAWLKARGRALIAEHLDRLRGQTQLFAIDGRAMKPAR